MEGKIEGTWRQERRLK